MINLLPLQQKEELKQEQNWKIVLILGILFVFFFISIFLILSSVKYFISGELQAQKIVFEQEKKELEVPSLQGLQNDLIDFNEALVRLDNFYGNQIYLVEIMERIAKALPGESYLTNLSLLQKENELDCNLSGFSATRNDLLQFKANLEENKSFKNIYFPQANWVEPVDINFTANFKINDDKE